MICQFLKINTVETKRDQLLNTVRLRVRKRETIRYKAPARDWCPGGGLPQMSHAWYVTLPKGVYILRGKMLSLICIHYQNQISKHVYFRRFKPLRWSYSCLGVLSRYTFSWLCCMMWSCLPPSPISAFLPRVKSSRLHAVVISLAIHETYRRFHDWVNKTSI